MNHSVLVIHFSFCFLKAIYNWFQIAGTRVLTHPSHVGLHNLSVWNDMLSLSYQKAFWIPKHSSVLLNSAGAFSPQVPSHLLIVCVTDQMQLLKWPRSLAWSSWQLLFQYVAWPEMYSLQLINCVTLNVSVVLWEYFSSEAMDSWELLSAEAEEYEEARLEDCNGCLF